MSDNRDSHPLFTDPKRLLLDMAQEQSLPELLRLIASRVGDSPRVALVRIWLAQPTADCTDCPTPEQCRGQSRCLYLVASGGRSAATPSSEWTRLDGAFRRFPFGARKVGRIAASGEPIEVPDLGEPQGERTRIRKLLSEKNLRHTRYYGSITANPYAVRTCGF